MNMPTSSHPYTLSDLVPDGVNPDTDLDAADLAAASSAYALAAADRLHPQSQGDGGFFETPPAMWPWDVMTWLKGPTEPAPQLLAAALLAQAASAQLARG